MSRIVRTGAALAWMSLALVAHARLMAASRADEPDGRDIPPAFASFEYLVGRWNGQAMPKDSAQSFRGWPEVHTWAWIFTKGKPSGLSVAIRGGKVLADARLTFDPARKRYRLDGTAPKPGGGPIAFEGRLDASGKMLVLDQVSTGKGEASEAGRGTVRLSIRPNSNFIRYTMGVDRKDSGAAQFRRLTEVGLTKEGESLAGGTTASERPKCIVTGGAATMTITYQGQTFPICCTGCRDEFNESPAKYIKKARLTAQSRNAKEKSGQGAPARVSRFEDAFSGDVADAPAMKAGGRSAGAAAKSAPARDEAGEDIEADESRTARPGQSAKKRAEPKTAAGQSSTRAAGLLRIGQNLERSGKTEAALENYKRIVKDFADTPSAKTARQRIKALEKP
jgi:YHS domain-containing protein